MGSTILRIISGAVIESYNNVIYGFFSLIITPIFFPNLDIYTATQLTFISFAAGFILRPVGSIIFGYIGDIYGRKIALQLTMLCSCITAFSIALTPSFQSVGWFAPIILIVSRLLQGLVTGVDYTGIVILIAEQKGIKNPIFIRCLFVALSFTGALIGVSVGFLLTLPKMPYWSWRMAFIVAGVLSYIVYYLRLKLQDFNHNTTDIKSDSEQLNLKNLLLTVIFGGANLVPVYLATIHINTDLQSILKLSTNAVFFNNFIILFLGLILVLLSSKLIKILGPVRTITYCMIWYIVLAIPAYVLAYHYATYEAFLILQIIIILADAPQIAALVIILPKLFPQKKRFRSMALSYSLGQTILGGTTPLIATYLVAQTHQAWSPSYFLVVTSILYLWAVRQIKNVEFFS